MVHPAGCSTTAHQMTQRQNPRCPPPRRYGSWGVCFTYGTWFGATALACRGHTAARDAALRRACAFLVGLQRSDGGWGESYLSCQDKAYSQLDGGSHVVNTAWAMMALLAAGYHDLDPAPLHQGRRLPDAGAAGQRRLAAAAHQRRLQPQLHDHLRKLQEHLPHLGAGPLQAAGAAGTHAGQQQQPAAVAARVTRPGCVLSATSGRAASPGSSRVQGCVAAAAAAAAAVGCSGSSRGCSCSQHVVRAYAGTVATAAARAAGVATEQLLLPLQLGNECMI
ncbi:terpenoid cyclases/protein prenyltransferase alpha-alpha toroid [Scenedesmus sp. NREL 46B-D3]|nr:terpenoid cyclases/protein prenyltransferase alpha-alpha toroid [Scenedesmus sp. NREL 46B-D3]